MKKIKVGEMVTVSDGTFKGFKGKVREVNEGKVSCYHIENEEKTIYVPETMIMAIKERKVRLSMKAEFTEEGVLHRAIFTDTQESAGYIVGWSGEYLAVMVGGKNARFTKLKDAKKYLLGA